MKILGIESTCDETGVAVVEDGRKVLSNVVASSLLSHKAYGGVVPEVAAREQVKVIIPVIEKVLKKYGKGDIDSLAISYGPGLIGSLLIGVETAKSLSLAWGKPLIAVNHLVGHVYASFLDRDDILEFPLVALIVSGGHTDLVYMKSHNRFELMGSTLDDAAGEAFDKVAKMLGLQYPGGPEVEKSAANHRGRSNKLFPRSMIKSNDFNFSFSGIKTSVLNYTHKNQLIDKKDISFEFQEAVCEILVSKTLRLALDKEVKTIVVGGGVAANSRLRVMMIEASAQKNLKVYFPEKKYSVDNGAMIASAAFFAKKFVDILDLNPDPSLHF